ncbi:hypothetical protein HPB48_014428 [Haemaphysalis longicornis]|uniref:Uncharacterized protein n=1 Tax=Haemaphysalis longicornis TaxID=44386 RepID=A0A9J6FVF1_HAELO|nr:hypothetical protein HPB48_014428 [Haemaphysalis longicornis]
MTSIDFERACTFASSSGCWLRNELALWNEDLNRYGLNLTEVEPEKLALSVFRCCHSAPYRSFAKHEHYTPSFFIAWLPRKHHCIRAMRLRSEVPRWLFPRFNGTAALVESAGDSSNLQKLEVSGTEYAQEACEAMRASADSLEDVSISNCWRRADVTDVLADIVKNAAQRMKKMSIRNSIENDNGMLDALLHCADLTELTLQFSSQYSVPWTMSQLLVQCNKLEKLSFDTRDLSQRCSRSLHAALAANTSLAQLHVVVRTVATCLAICEAVGHSSSLKTLQLSFPYTSPVCAEGSVALLLANTGLKTLIVRSFRLCQDHSRSVADGLAGNSVLELLDVKNSTVDEGALSLLTGSLEMNTTLKKMKIGKSSAPRRRAIHFWSGGTVLEPPRGEWLSDTLGKAGSAARTRVGDLNCRCEGVCSVALALTDSPTVTSFEAGNTCLDFPCFDVCKTITRNLGLLNDAARFVTRADVSKRCALAFETLATAPSFREHLGKVTGKSETECELAVRAAAGFLADNFFVITGVVQRSLSCHPGEGTQLDELKGENLGVVTRRLRVSDVKD